MASIAFLTNLLSGFFSVVLFLTVASLFDYHQIFLFYYVDLLAFLVWFPPDDCQHLLPHHLLPPLIPHNHLINLLVPLFDYLSRMAVSCSSIFAVVVISMIPTYMHIHANVYVYSNSSRLIITNTHVGVYTVIAYISISYSVLKKGIFIHKHSTHCIVLITRRILRVIQISKAKAAMISMRIPLDICVASSDCIVFVENFGS